MEECYHFVVCDDVNNHCFEMNRDYISTSCPMLFCLEELMLTELTHRLTKLSDF